MQEYNKRLAKEIKQISKEIIILSIGRLICFFIGLISLFFMEEDVWLLTPFLSAVFVVMFSVHIRKKEYRKKKLARDIIITTLAQTMDVIGYHTSRRIPETSVRGTCLLPAWDKYSGHGVADCIYRNLGVSISDIFLEKKQVVYDSKGRIHTSYIPVFEGQWVIIELPKSLKCSITIRERGRFECAQLGRTVLTPNKEFNKRFCVESDNEFAALSILTPHFMDYLLNLEKLTVGKIYFSFRRNLIHIAISNDRNFFEIQSFGNDLELLQTKIEEETEYITNIIDELLLNPFLHRMT